MLFLLEWIPSWLFLIILVLGILGFLLTLALKLIPIPAVYVYRVPIQIISIIVMIIGSFLCGAAYVNDQWLEKVRQLEEKVRIAEENAKRINTEVIEKIVYRDRVVREKGEQIIKYVDREIIKKEEVVKFVENCPLPKDIVDAHNAAAIMNEAAKGNKK